MRRTSTSWRRSPAKAWAWWRDCSGILAIRPCDTRLIAPERLLRRHGRVRLLCLRLHLAPNADGLRIIVKRDVGGGHEFAGRNAAHKLDVMRQPDRQGAEFQA